MYRNHRARFLERLTREGAAAVIPTASPKTRNHDCEYRFRPDSDFWYLTGFAEPESVLVLLPGKDGGAGKSVLFLRERDKNLEIWNGRRLGVERAPDSLGVDCAFAIEDLWDELPSLLLGCERIVYRTGVDAENDRQMIDTINTLRGRARGGVRPPIETIDHVPYLHELRLYKDADEQTNMRRAAAITEEAHKRAMAETAPGVYENEIDALIEYTFKRRGSTGPAYTNIVAGGVNACILHYNENDAELKDGDLLLIDAGAELDYYASDVTRTFPVNGSFSTEQRAIYELVLESQIAGVEHIKPGVSFLSIHDVATGVLIDGLIRLGLLKGTREEALESDSYQRFYMHKTGHWLGLDVHDCGYYAEDGDSRLLEPGMTLTVEPGLYIAEDEETVDAKWRGIGVRIEDDILVTQNGFENLTAAIPKTVDEVEAACRGEELASALH